MLSLLRIVTTSFAITSSNISSLNSSNSGASSVQEAGAPNLQSSSRSNSPEDPALKLRV